MNSVCHSPQWGKSSRNIAAAGTDAGAVHAPFVWRFGEVSSCLDVAFLLAARDWLKVWDSVQAVSQTAGRGQLRRFWASPPGNIYAALRLPVQPPFDSTAAAPVMGLLLADALRAEGWPVLLKWPNDLALCLPDGTRKLAGILLEERGGILLAGIGVNVNSAPPDAALRPDAAMPAASLSAVSTHSVPLAEFLWRRLVKHMHSAYDNGHSLADQWKKRAEEVLLWRGRHVHLADGEGSVRGRLEGLTPAGGLLLWRNGRCEEWLSGSLRLSERLHIKG
ncbi:biotin--[acetyl-CoA-carboxylase] ligase [uncultured Desulfovibrio sp.]|uniref:biotin--[acetyl-CoA-carboxylase] ligase n=1 Tax=uncultured Desulfovibrio sp. TaxID=167968 RepID=UPI002602F71E|nr:biotin--[acetyl-CoA-carboxylase] ligase [uncultured Desulfovibrio sp.]